jgi:hypothetical protein
LTIFPNHERNHDSLKDGKKRNILPILKINESLSLSFIDLTRDGSILFNNINNIKRMEKQQIKNIEHDFKSELANDEFISGIFEESCLGDTMGDLHCFSIKFRVLC